MLKSDYVVDLAQYARFFQSDWWGGFGNRQCRGLGHTNEGTRYDGGLPGDTPEYMSLDNNLFADLEVMVRWNVATTFELPRGHPDKFDLTTPTSAWDTECRS